MARSRNPTINSKLVLEWDGLRIDKALSSRIRRGLPKALVNQQPRPLGTSHVYDETQYRQWISLGSDIYLAGLFFSIEALMPDITSYEFMASFALSLDRAMPLTNMMANRYSGDICAKLPWWSGLDVFMDTKEAVPTFWANLLAWLSVSRT